MSAKLAMQVLESGLNVSLKPAAVCMAMFGNDAGERIFPSVERVAYLLGVSRRTAERQLARLRRLGVLVPLSTVHGGRLTGGRGQVVHYRLRADALPFREPYQPRRPRRGSDIENPDSSAGVVTDGNPDTYDENPDAANRNPDAGVARTPTPVSDDLVFDPSLMNVRENEVPRFARVSHTHTQSEEEYKDFRAHVEKQNPELAAQMKTPAEYIADVKRALAQREPHEKHRRPPIGKRNHSTQRGIAS